MQDFIVNIMNSYGYLGVFLLIMIENVFPPIPSEVILLFGGFMTTYTKLKIIGMVIASTLGSVVGALILYQIGKIFNKDRLKKILSAFEEIKISGECYDCTRYKDSNDRSSSK